MSTSEESSGFTLIEIVLVFAISGLLFIIAFAGQRQLRDRAGFDASINQIVQDINYARNYAISNVNEIGTGNDTKDLYVGANIEWDENHINEGFPLTEVEPLYTGADSSGDPIWNTISNWPPHATLADCPNSQHPSEPGPGQACHEIFFTTNDDISMVGDSKINVYFVNQGNGLHICSDVNYQYPSIAAACSAAPGAPIKIGFKDSAGFKATIQIDSNSGLAHRIN